jgi:hypothetical protein
MAYRSSGRFRQARHPPRYAAFLTAPSPRFGHSSREDEERLTADVVELARRYGRYGCRKVTTLLRDAGWLVNAKRVERIWRSYAEIWVTA